MEITVKSLRACQYKEDLKVGNPDPKHDIKNDTEMSTNQTCIVLQKIFE